MNELKIGFAAIIIMFFVNMFLDDTFQIEWPWWFLMFLNVIGLFSILALVSAIIIGIWRRL